MRVKPKFSARFYSKQHYFPDIPVSLYRQRIATNRPYDSNPPY